MLIDARLFVSHSGLRLRWKFNCDHLSAEDITNVATLASERFTFCDVYGVPSGGTRLAQALSGFVDKSSNAVLIVDDVMTSAHLMEELRQRLLRGGYFVNGAVILARCTTPSWVRCLLREGDL